MVSRHGVRLDFGLGQSDDPSLQRSRGFVVTVFVVNDVSAQQHGVNGFVDGSLDNPVPHQFAEARSASSVRDTRRASADVNVAGNEKPY